MDKQHAPAHLPKGHEDDGLDQHKLEQGVIGSQEVMRSQVEQQQCVQCYCVCDVVHYCDPQVPAAYHSYQDLTAFTLQPKLLKAYQSHLLTPAKGPTHMKAISSTLVITDCKQVGQSVGSLSLYHHNKEGSRLDVP